jgi:3-deoxy-D-manno-octulosonic-acid transferase
MIHAVYSAALAVGLLGYVPVVLARRLTSRGHPTHLRERLGAAAGPLPPAPRCWIHAVSVGESVTAIPLVQGIRRRWPELGIVLSTVTPTGARVVADHLGQQVTHWYFPLDLPGPVQLALRRIEPRFFIGMETELWPNFFRALSRRSIPRMIANGRISDRSFRRYRRVACLMRRLLREISIIAMQSEEDARRIIALGAPPERVVVTGSLKADQEPEDPGARELWARLLSVAPDERVWVAGSTHRGEEEVVAAVFQRLATTLPRLVLLLAPRHPERVAEVERLLGARGLRTVRRSQLPGDRREREVILLDSVGELAQCYRVAEVVFVGGSLVPVGGHNMLEPALRRKPVLFGPHTANFRESAERLRVAGGALVVHDAQALEEAVGRLLADRGLAITMGEAAFEAVAGQQGALNATLDLVERYLYPGHTPAGAEGR